MDARRLNEELALDLLKRDGIAVIWLLHLTAGKAHREGHPRASETLLAIADAAEQSLRHGGVAPHRRGIAPSPGSG
jgi:hypothetical protein